MGFIQIPEQVSIAFYSIALIAKAKGKILTTREIAENSGASENHLAKIMQRLVKSDLIHSTRGPGGGFMLKKDPGTIALYDIYKIIEGEIKETKCPLNRNKCPFNQCMYNGLLFKLSEELKSFLTTKTLLDFIN